MPTVPVLQTAADLSASQIAGAASALVPTGVVLPFAGSSAPAGWLLCSGQEISQTTYADLYAVLLTTYNLQTNPTTGSAWAAPTAGTFRLPDYRGSFLRGVGTFTDGVGTDTTIGGYQADAMQGHNHAVPTNDGSGGGGVDVSVSGSPSASTNSIRTDVPANDGTNGTPRTSKETRVRNKGVNYIIKT